MSKKQIDKLHDLIFNDQCESNRLACKYYVPYYYMTKFGYESTTWEEVELTFTDNLRLTQLDLIHRCEQYLKTNHPEYSKVVILNMMPL